MTATHTAERPQVVTSDPAPAPRIETGPIGTLFSTARARALITPLLRGATYDAVVSEIHILVRRNPKIIECTGESIIMSVCDALRWGLVFGETVHMVPFNEMVDYQHDIGGGELRWRERKELRAYAIVGWKGAIELVVRAGSARDVDPQVVYENELANFAIRLGTKPDVQHFRILDPEKRGPIVGGYCVARITEYHQKVVWMAAQEINELRKKYSKQYKDGPLEAWYVRKATVLQMCNRLPKNRKLDEALQVMNVEQRIVEADDVEATVTSAAPAPAVPTQRALGAGPVQTIDTRTLRQTEPVEVRVQSHVGHTLRAGVPIHPPLSDDELDRMAREDEG